MEARPRRVWRRRRHEARQAARGARADDSPRQASQARSFPATTASARRTPPPHAAAAAAAAAAACCRRCCRRRRRHCCRTPPPLPITGRAVLRVQAGAAAGASSQTQQPVFDRRGGRGGRAPRSIDGYTSARPYLAKGSGPAHACMRARAEVPGMHVACMRACEHACMQGRVFMHVHACRSAWSGSRRWRRRWRRRLRPQ